ncbi:MAG: carboxypeptidase-like regulatory domain-containing protein [Oscillospiraceae bacterium]|nr:carboxypeptidase-like regulatory domain-containing protein [Oscillospiraceae bacterium]
MSAFTKFYFRPSKDEWVHAVASPDKESGSGIYGRVEEKGVPVARAMVLLLRAEGERSGKPLSSVITDEEGDFAFGPLEAGQLYVIKIFRDGVKLRELELTV